MLTQANFLDKAGDRAWRALYVCVCVCVYMCILGTRIDLTKLPFTRAIHSSFLSTILRTSNREMHSSCDCIHTIYTHKCVYIHTSVYIYTHKTFVQLLFNFCSILLFGNCRNNDWSKKVYNLRKSEEREESRSNRELVKLENPKLRILV